jgi:hypothetical protein
MALPYLVEESVMNLFNKLIAIGAAGAAMLAGVHDAAACGCFTPPDPSVPVVQAGERIAFALDQGQVTAHIQIQYAGDAKDFGWLLPLPAVPNLQLGTDELFNQLIAQTQPKYKVNRVYEGNCSFDPSRSGGFNNSAAPTAGGSTGGGGQGDISGQSPLVIQDSIGPYDYAVLKADSKDAMLQWLTDNHYFVPAGTDDTVGPYIRPGAFFLALKLQSGRSAGDLQPVVVNYASDLPMIPIVLTSTGAKPNMGVQVWMLGAGRAIPRNYYHTVINDALLDWINGSQNYNDVIIKAAGEAPGKHTFVTEYAGKSDIMKNLLNPPGRFGTTPELAAQPDEISFVQYLLSHQFTFTSQLTAILQTYIPVPPALLQQGITAQIFYSSISYYLGPYRQQNPQLFVGYTTSYQPAMMADEIDMRVVQPTLQAGALFDKFPYLTRLYTTISPEDMNKDPVFSYNAGLPDYPNVHEGTLTYHCGLLGNGNQANTPATLRTSNGWVLSYPYGVATVTTIDTLPASERIEILREEGNPEVVTDNTPKINGQLGSSGGCGYILGGRAERTGGTAALLLVVGLVVVWRRRHA